MPVLSDITLGQYYPVDSFIHSLDPRAKLLSTLICMTIMLVFSHLSILIMMAIILYAIIRLSHVPVSYVFKNLRPFLWLFLLTIIIHILFSESTDKVSIPFVKLSISKSGIISGLTYSLRLCLLILFAAILTLTTSPIEITDALEKILAPLNSFGLPVHDITMMMTLSLRFIPTLIQEADKLRKAQISRGVNFKGNLVNRIKNVVPLILPLFMSVFRRADELALAMDARCYTGSEERTRYKKLEFEYTDYIVISVSLLILICALVLKYVHLV